MKPVWRPLQVFLGIDPPRQRELIERVSTAVASTIAEVIQHMKHTPGFDPVGARMLWHWNDGLNRLNQRISTAVPDIKALTTEAGVAEPTPPQSLLRPGMASRRCWRPSAGQSRCGHLDSAGMSLPLNRNTACTPISAWSVSAGSHWTIGGTPVQVVDLVIPELQRQGLFRTAYENKTLSENLAGLGYEI